MIALGDCLPVATWPGVAAAGVCLTALPWLKRDDALTRNVIVGVCLMLTARYLNWRWTQTLPPLAFSTNYIFGVVFVTVETLSMLGAALSMVFLTRVRNRSPDVEANLEWLTRQQPPPRVDVFICTYNEEEAILERTMIGALALSYPNFRVWMLDDGRRSWLAALCEKVGCGYIARDEHSHAKAGNINNALGHVAGLGSPPDFIAILDADFVPMPDFLTRALALFREEDVAVVQTPQHFANPDPVQSNLSLAEVWPDEQRYFFDILMASKDAWGAAFCCGTSSIIRFAPLWQMGGFPTDSVTEDYLLTLRLQQIGFRTVYLNERLSFGLAPEGLKEYVVQRSRWCLGFMQICMGPSGPLRPENGLRLVDRVTLIETFLHWSAAHAYRLLGLAMPISYMLFDVQAVQANPSDALWYFAPFFAFQIGGIGWLSEWRCLPILADLSALLAATEILKSVYRGVTKPLGQKFQVTAKGGDRSKRFIQTPMLAIFFGFLVLTLAGIYMRFLLEPDRDLQDSSLVVLFWSWYNIVILALACLVCIEQPRLRRSERFRAEGNARLVTGRTRHVFPIKDISTGGVCLRGESPARVGARVGLEIDGNHISAHIVRIQPEEFALAVEDNFETRAATIRAVYSGHFNVGIAQIEPRKVASRLARRVFG